MQLQGATLVIIEFGASWPSWLDPGYGGNMAVIAQHYEGVPGSIVEQVESRMSRLLSTGWSVEEVVLVANGRGDLESLSARSLLGRGLLAHLRNTRGRRLTLTLAADLGQRAVHVLATLASALDGSALACGVELCLRIGDAEPVSNRSLELRAASAG
jgi:hypothetical protein